jgi:5-carboxymethyl-2-hydroxymuconate isomerase
MPHLVLEASANIHECNVRLEQMLLECHQILVEKLPTQIESCRSRVVLHDIYVVGDNTPNHAFMHLTVKLLKGRTKELLMDTGELLKLKLQEFCSRSMEHLKLHISVEITELSDVYIK